MFTVTDQFGAVWEVLGQDGADSSIDRLPMQIDYAGTDPLFIIYYWTSHKSRKQVSIVAHTNYLAGITRKYANTKNAGLDEILVSLPPRLTKCKTHKLTKLLKFVILINSEFNIIGCEYTTIDGVYSDLGTQSPLHTDSLVVFEQ